MNLQLVYRYYLSLGKKKKQNEYVFKTQSKLRK